MKTRGAYTLFLHCGIDTRFCQLLEEAEVHSSTDDGAEEDGEEEKEEKWELRTTTGGDDDGRASREVLAGAEIGFGGFFLGVDVLFGEFRAGFNTGFFAGANRVIIGLSIIRKGAFFDADGF